MEEHGALLDDKKLFLRLWLVVWHGRVALEPNVVERHTVVHVTCSRELADVSACR
jgi:hypothetical protein